MLASVLASPKQRMGWLTAVATTIGAASYVLAAEPPSQPVLREAHFDAADDRIVNATATHRLLIEKGQSFNMPYQGQSAPPRLSAEVAMDGSQSLALTIGPSAPSQTQNDRSEFTVAHQGDPLALRLGEDRYLGFGVFFSEAGFPPPTAEIIVCQIWQAYRDHATGPPAFIVMEPNSDDLSFRLATRDDGDPKSVAVPLSRAKFVPGSWNAVVLHVLPRADGDPAGPGVIEIWLNGHHLGGALRFWGHTAPNSVDAFDVRVGMYGNPQPAAHSLWIDRVRWGLSRAAVDPSGTVQ